MTILHPELLRDLRGDKYIRRIWNEFVKADTLSMSKDGLEYHKLAPEKLTPLAYAALRDTAQLRQVERNGKYSVEILRLEAAIMTLLGCYKGPVYRIGEDFFNALKNVSINIPADLLKGLKNGYVALPKNVLAVTGFYFCAQIKDDSDLRVMLAFTPEPGAESKINYVLEEAQRRIPENPSIKAVERLIEKEWPLAACQLLTENLSFITLHLNGKMSIEDAVNYSVAKNIERVEKTSSDAFLKTYNELVQTETEAEYQNVKDLATYALNCLLYINSQEPDLQKSVPATNLTIKRKRELTAKGYSINELTIPVINVSWNYKKPVMHKVDSTWVETFPRWQPCGPKNSQVKLIWVTPFERHYKNVRPDLSNEI